MKKTILTFIFSMIAIVSQAGTISIAGAREFLYSDFIISIIAGVLLALIFQILLTALSVAFGITMIGNVKKSFVENRVNPSGDSGERDGISGFKISTAFGMWSLLTTSIALFTASGLALNLSYFGTLLSNMTLALVIWSLFFIILFYIETKIVHTVVGSLVTTATSGLMASAEMVRQLFRKSDTIKTEDLIENTIVKVRKEFNVNLNTDKIGFVLDNFLHNFDNHGSSNTVEGRQLNYDDLKAELKLVIDDSNDSFSIVKYRIGMLDSRKVKALVLANKYTNESNVDDIEDQILEVIKEIKDKTIQIEKKVNKTIEKTDRKAVIQAEHARKTAASAAWWLVLTVVFSGGAAMFGAYLELLYN